jgi:predicted GNAT family N-acyltransferase
MRVREMNDGDLERVAKLYNDNFKASINVHNGLYTPENIGKWFGDSNQHWLLVGSDSAVFGVAVLNISPIDNLGEVERVCVAEEHRGEGVSQKICSDLLDIAVKKNIGFVETYARGDQPAMQKVFANLDFGVYGIAPRFNIIHNGVVVRKPFVHMGKVLSPESVSLENLQLVPPAGEIYKFLTEANEKSYSADVLSRR